MTRKKSPAKSSGDAFSPPRPRPINDLAMANRLLGGIYSIVQVITAQGLSYEKRLGLVLQEIIDYLGAEQGSIMLLEKNRLVVKAATRTELIGQKQSLEEVSVATWVARARKPLFVPDITRDKRFKKRSGGTYKKDALLSVPITHGDKLIGVINASDKSGQANFFKEDIAFLLDFSSLVLSLVIQEGLNEKTIQQRNILRLRNQELRRQEKARGELTRMLIHDLKGPLSEVIANLDILSYSVGQPEKDFVESAQIGCERAVRMAENLGTIGKIEDGKLELLKGEIRPALLLQEAISGVRGLAKLKQVELISEAAEDLPPISLDRVLILRVLQNLLMNALSYAPPASTITVGCRPDNSGNRLEFQVTDQGPGIPESERLEIFEKYVRLKHRQNPQTGTGLGLYFCKLAVQKHKGEIGVDNLPGAGSRFHFLLPRQ